MSRIGKQPVKLPDGIKASIESGILKIEGPKGKMEHSLNSEFEYKSENGAIVVAPKGSIEKDRRLKALFGLERALINNKVTGVAEGFKKILILKGVGYRAQVQGKKITLTLGFSHPVVFDVPENVNASLEGQTKLILESIDRQLVGETAAKIKRLRPPEPYKGKGIMYEGERIRRKAGKSAAGAKGK
ncbi:MAG: 50S ribosomal protein L6 [Candidatus Goldiibacteriota bacterium]